MSIWTEIEADVGKVSAFVQGHLTEWEQVAGEVPTLAKIIDDIVAEAEGADNPVTKIVDIFKDVLKAWTIVKPAVEANSGTGAAS